MPRRWPRIAGSARAPRDDTALLVRGLGVPLDLWSFPRSASVSEAATGQSLLSLFMRSSIRSLAAAPAAEGGLGSRSRAQHKSRRRRPSTRGLSTSLQAPRHKPSRPRWQPPAPFATRWLRAAPELRIAEGERLVRVAQSRRLMLCTARGGRRQILHLLAQVLVGFIVP